MAACSSEEILASLIETLELCGGKMKEGCLGEVMEDLETSFSLQDFWLKLGMTFRAVSKEATKLAVVFSKPPAPSREELEGLLTGLETAIIAMLTVFHSLPLLQGRTLHKKLQQAIAAIVDDVKGFVESLLKEGCKSNKATNQSTGTLWEHCDAFHTLPLDNKYAVLDVFKSTSELVKDALTELEQAQSANGRQDVDPLDDTEDQPTPHEHGWSDHDRHIVPPCVGIVKACRSSLKKISNAVRTNGKSTTSQMVNDLDSVANTLQDISPRVDELVSSLYAPVNHTSVSEKVTDLSDTLKDLLQKSRESHFTVEADNTWLDFLRNAVDHNRTKLSSVIADNMGNESHPTS